MYSVKSSTFAFLLVALFGCAESPSEDVSFLTPDGGLVYAIDTGKGEHAVILAHGGRFTKESWSEQIPDFVEAGFRVIAIDFRGRGDSRGPQGSSSDEHMDVIGAIDYARASGAQRISIVGSSFGGSAAAAAVAERPGLIANTVILAAPVEEPDRITGRTAYIVARDDVQGEGTLRLPAIEEDMWQTPEPRKLVVLDGSAHAQFLFDTPQADRLMKEILDVILDRPELQSWVCEADTEVRAEMGPFGEWLEADLPWGGVSMQRTRAASGVRFADGDVVFWMKGDSAFVQRGENMALSGCVLQ